MTNLTRMKLLAAMIAGAVACGLLAQPVERRTGSGVNWMSGGVTEEERGAMQEVAPAFNLKVVVARSGDGDYRADVPVAVENTNGEPVLSVVTDGPLLYANVPPGRYRIRTGDGQESSVDVGMSGSTVVYFHSPTE